MNQCTVFFLLDLLFFFAPEHWFFLFFFLILTLNSSAIKADSVHRRLGLGSMYSKGCLATGWDPQSGNSTGEPPPVAYL